MMKRATWFTAGAVAGVLGTRMAKKKVQAVAIELSPSNLAHKAADRAREAAHEGAEAIKAKVTELRVRLTAQPEESAEVIELHRRRA
ncbi:hypothetical protein BH10ACT2_BH10ACT2_03500 [soil metagenome]